MENFSMEIFLTVLSYIGVVAFSVSGAMVAIRSEVDIFGVVLMSVTTTFGGGLLRDAILNRYPYPALFEMKYEFICCVATALIVFFLAAFFRDTYLKREGLVETINNILDSAGLSAFAVTGTQSAMETMLENRAEPILAVAITMGMITCIGGGLMRDVILGKLPWVLKKRVYAIAALVGSGAYVLLRRIMEQESIAMLIACVLVFGFRMCATFFRWNMPVAIRFSELDKPSRHLSFIHRDAGAHDTVKK